MAIPTVGEALNLTDILLGKQTDKLANGFVPHYERIFEPIRYHVRCVVEIGVDRGGSIEAWLEYFPNARVIGIDIQPNLDVEDLGYTHLQMDVKELEGIADAVDIVIDDGSHYNTDVFIAFEKIWPSVIEGGYYIVEDIQVPYRDESFPSIGEYFMDFVKHNNVKAYMFDWNLLWIRKDQD